MKTKTTKNTIIFNLVSLSIWGYFILSGWDLHTNAKGKASLDRRKVLRVLRGRYQVGEQCSLALYFFLSSAVFLFDLVGCSRGNSGQQGGANFFSFSDWKSYYKD